VGGRGLAPELGSQEGNRLFAVVKAGVGQGHQDLSLRVFHVFSSCPAPAASKTGVEGGSLGRVTRVPDSGFHSGDPIRPSPACGEGCGHGWCCLGPGVNEVALARENKVVEVVLGRLELKASQGATAAARRRREEGGGHGGDGRAAFGSQRGEATPLEVLRGLGQSTSFGTIQVTEGGWAGTNGAKIKVHGEVNRKREREREEKRREEKKRRREEEKKRKGDKDD